MKKKRTQMSEFGIQMLPCPFCGKTYRGIVICSPYNPGRIECSWCGAEGPFPKQPDKNTEKDYAVASIKAWNRREK